MKDEAHRALTLVNHCVNRGSCTALLRVGVPRAHKLSTKLANKTKKLPCVPEESCVLHEHRGFMPV